MTFKIVDKGVVQFYNECIGTLGRENIPTGGDADFSDKSNSPNSRNSENLLPPVQSEWERADQTNQPFLIKGAVCLASSSKI